MKFVVTGSSGLLGSSILSVAEDHDVYSLYNQHTPSSGIPVRADLQDLGHLERSLQGIKPDVIVHAAALTDVDRCERDRGLANAINYEATKAIAKCANDLHAFLVYVSTDYVFDGVRGRYGERDEPNPVNFYGLTKLMGERSVKKLLTNYLVVRTSVIYGSTPSSGKVNFALWVLNTLKEGKPANVAVDQFVSPTLNTNLAEMMMECLERRLTGTIHLAGATRVSRYDFASKICREWSLDASLINPVRMNEMDWHAARPRDSSLDVSKATTTLKRPPNTISQSLHALKEELDADLKMRA